MNSSPGHEELQEMLPAAALDILDPSDLQHVLVHVQSCKECAQALEEYQEVTAGLGLVLPRRVMDPSRSASLRAKLLARARRDLPATAPDPATAPAAKPILAATGSAHTGFITGRWSGWTVAAALAGVLLMHHAVHRPLDYGWLAAGALMVVIVALGAYASVQRSRSLALQKRLAATERGEMPD